MSIISDDFAVRIIGVTMNAGAKQTGDSLLLSCVSSSVEVRRTGLRIYDRVQQWNAALPHVAAWRRSRTGWAVLAGKLLTPCVRFDWRRGSLISRWTIPLYVPHCLHHLMGNKVPGFIEAALDCVAAVVDPSVVRFSCFLQVAGRRPRCHLLIYNDPAIS